MQIAMNPEDTSVCPNFTTWLISLTTFENSDYIIFPKEKPCAQATSNQCIYLIAQHAKMTQYVNC